MGRNKTDSLCNQALFNSPFHGQLELFHVFDSNKPGVPTVAQRVKDLT